MRSLSWSLTVEVAKPIGRLGLYTHSLISEIQTYTHPIEIPNMLRRFSIVIGLLTFTACGHAPVSDSSGSGDKTTCYWGESRMVLPDGRRVSKYQTLVRRVLMPEKSLIGEAVAALIPNRPNGIHRFGSVVEPDGTFRFKETQSGAKGEGRLEGRPWAWNAWSSTTHLADRITVTSKTILNGDLMNSTKSVRGADGTLKFTIKDRLSLISRAECERRFKRLERESSKAMQVQCKAACIKLKRCESKLDLADKRLDSLYCEDRCLKREQSRAFRCVMALQPDRCSDMARCIKGKDID